MDSPSPRTRAAPPTTFWAPCVCTHPTFPPALLLHQISSSGSWPCPARPCPLRPAQGEALEGGRVASRSRTVLSKLVARAGCPRALEGTRFRVWLRGRSLGTGGSVRGKEGSRKPGRVCSPTSWQEVLHPSCPEPSRPAQQAALLQMRSALPICAHRLLETLRPRTQALEPAGSQPAPGCDLLAGILQAGGRTQWRHPPTLVRLWMAMTGLAPANGAPASFSLGDLKAEWGGR